MNMRLLNVSIDISLIEPTRGLLCKAFASVPDAVYETLAIATVVHTERERVDNIPRLTREVKFICPGIKRSNKARIGPRGYSSDLAPP